MSRIIILKPDLSAKKGEKGKKLNRFDMTRGIKYDKKKTQNNANVCSAAFLYKHWTVPLFPKDGGSYELQTEF